MTSDLPVCPKPFVLLERITAWTDAQIHGRGSAWGSWGLLESCAQICAFHVRVTHNFSGHAFLLGFVFFPVVEDNGSAWDLWAELHAASSHSFVYGVRACQDGQCFAGELRIGLVPYDAQFQESVLRPHYEELFAWLTRF